MPHLPGKLIVIFSTSSDKTVQMRGQCKLRAWKMSASMDPNALHSQQYNYQTQHYIMLAMQVSYQIRIRVIKRMCNLRASSYEHHRKNSVVLLDCCFVCFQHHWHGHQFVCDLWASQALGKGEWVLFCCHSKRVWGGLLSTLFRSLSLLVYIRVLIEESH